MFWKRNFIALSLLVTSLVLFGLVMWQRSQMETNTEVLNGANKDIVRLQGEVEQWQARHTTLEQALRDCQDEVRRRTVPRLPGTQGKL